MYVSKLNQCVICVLEDSDFTDEFGAFYRSRKIESAT